MVTDPFHLCHEFVLMEVVWPDEAHLVHRRRLVTLKAQGTLIRAPQDVPDSARESTFFDPHDIVQVKYDRRDFW
jgi:hypothetical protein